MNIDEKSKYIVIGEKENIITKIGENNYIGAICDDELKNSVEFKWKIKILNTLEYRINIGVVPSSFDFKSSSYNNCGWYFYCKDSTLWSGPPYNYEGKKQIYLE